MSLAAFLEWDDGTDTRYELVDGRLVAKAPTVEAHGTIVANLAAAIRPRLDSSRMSFVAQPRALFREEETTSLFGADLIA